MRGTAINRTIAEHEGNQKKLIKNGRVSQDVILQWDRREATILYFKRLVSQILHYCNLLITFNLLFVLM